jgi:hypothetical protein
MMARSVGRRTRDAESAVHAREWSREPKRFEFEPLGLCCKGGLLGTVANAEMRPKLIGRKMR